MLQVTDPRTLRKLARRVDEIPTVKDFLVRAVSGGPYADGEPEMYLGPFKEEVSADVALARAAVVKKVKENAHLTALLQEIGEYLSVHNWEAAQKTAKRVIEVPQAVQSVKPVDAR